MAETTTEKRKMAKKAAKGKRKLSKRKARIVGTIVRKRVT